jgi:hypothetical protein
MDQKWIDKMVGGDRLRSLTDQQLTHELSELRPASAHSPSQQAAANFVIKSYLRELDQREAARIEAVQRSRHRALMAVSIVAALAAILAAVASLM